MNYYNQKDYPNSKLYFEQYLSDYEDGIFLIPSSFYLAESYWKDNDTLNAILFYKNVIDYGKTEYLEPSLVRLSRYSYLSIPINSA